MPWCPSSERTAGTTRGTNAFEPFRRDGLSPGRAAVQHRGAYDVMTEQGDVRARVAPRLRRASTPADFPVVGDWVGLDGNGVIQAVLPRRTAFVRRAAADTGSGTVREQVVAANVDVVLIAAALGQELDPLVLERLRDARAPERGPAGDPPHEGRPRGRARVGRLRARGRGRRDPDPLRLEQERHRRRADSLAHRTRRDGRAPRPLRRGQVDAREPARRGRRACSRPETFGPTAPAGTRPPADSSSSFRGEVS